ncbi:hypothetical protein ACNQKP_14740 [Bdellovibrio bacteriovorus]|uniref:hypothetical protein n=1 Tax=Bdellovibrio bacteriovorus TaxID=959 RepID=UPI003AA88BD3
MRWKLKPKSLMKSLAASASAFTMCMAPVAQGAAAQDQKKLINQYLKETGLTTKKMTVGEFYRMVRHVYPHKLQKQMDQWVELNRHEMMPAVEASTYKGSDGKEQVRLTLTHAGQTSTWTFTGDDENPLKVNGVNFKRKELMNYNNFNAIAGKMVKLDPVVAKSLKTGKQKPLSKNFVLTYKEYTRLTPRQKAEYFVRMRAALESAQKVYKTIYGAQALNEFNKRHEWAASFLFGEEAQAASLTGKPCIVAGYLSIYGENGSCGGSKQGAIDLKNKMEVNSATCLNNGVSCNPMVYGFSANGSPHCVSRSEVKYATRVCNSKSPLRTNDPKSEGEDKKRIIESYLKKVEKQDINLVLNEEGKISQEQYNQISAYLGGLQNFINSAVAECGQAPLQKIAQQRDDQMSACNEIKTRAFSLQSFVVSPEPPPPPGPIAGGDCSVEKPGSVPGEGGKGCVCPEGTKESEPSESESRPSCLVIEAGGEGDLPGGKTEVGKDDSCGFWCRNKNWIIPVGIGLLALGAFWWLFSKKSKSDSKSPEYVPPAPAPEPEPTATTTVTTPPVVDPPPTAPCPAPNQLINNVCVPVVVVPPPTPDSEGGTTTDTSIRAGGVR